MLIAPIRRLADMANPITRGLAALERGLALIDEIFRRKTQGRFVLERAAGHIELRRVCVNYRGDDEARALDGVSLAIEPGEVRLSFVRALGSGKTTLVNLLLALRAAERRRKGAARWPRGRRHESSASLRSQFAMVSRDVVMLNDSLAANVALGAAIIDRKRVLECVAAANLAGPRGRPAAGHRHRAGPLTRPSCRAASGSAWRSRARSTRTRGHWCCSTKPCSALDTESERHGARSAAAARRRAARR